MNWRRIFAVMAVRIGMIAAVFFMLMLIRACALMEKEPKLAIITAGTGLEYAQLPPFKINHVHRLYFFPNEGKETETEVKESGNVIILKKKIYIDGTLRDELEYDKAGNVVKAISYYDEGSIDTWYESAYDEMGNLIKKSSLTKGTEYGYHFNIFGELFVFKTMKEESVTEYEYEYASETAGQIRSTVIGEVEILEKSLQTTIEVEGWSRVRTWDLKYPYFSGDQVVLLGEINNQIYEWVRDKNMVDSEGVYYTELTYEITYMDERFVSILFEGEGGGNSYYGYSHGMSFDLKTGELLSLTDFYEWSEWKNLMENAMEQDQLRTQILRGYMELEEDENREYLEEYFIPLFQEDSDLKKDNLDFYIKDGYLYFITHAYPSCREDSYIRWEDKKDDLEEQGEEKTPLMLGED